MYSAISAVWPLLLGIALIMLGNGLQGTLLGVRATLENFPTSVTGLVMTGYFVGVFLGSFLSPRIVERVGHIRVFAAFASLASASALIHAVFVEPWSWGFMRLVTGFSYAGLYIVAESWLNDRATNETRGQILSIYMIVTYGSMTVGQFLLNVGDPGGFTLFVLISVLVSLALVPISLTAVSAPSFDTPASVSLFQLYRISPLGVIGGLGGGVSFGVVFGMGAVYARGVGMSVAEVSWFMGLILFGGMLMQWPLGKFSDLVDRRKLLLGVSIFIAICCMLAGFEQNLPIYPLLAVAFFLGGAVLPMYSLCSAHLNDHLDPSQMVAASGGFVLLSGLGASIGPISASAVMSLAGPRGFFLTIGLVYTGIALFALWRMTRRAPVPQEDRGSFVPMPPRSSSLAAALNPETPEDADDWEDILVETDEGPESGTV